MQNPTFDDVAECLKYGERYIIGSTLEFHSYWMKVAPWETVGKPPVFEASEGPIPMSKDELLTIQGLFKMHNIPATAEFWSSGTVIVRLLPEQEVFANEALELLHLAGYQSFDRDSLYFKKGHDGNWFVFPYRFTDTY